MQVNHVGRFTHPSTPPSQPLEREPSPFSSGWTELQDPLCSVSQKERRFETNSDIAIAYSLKISSKMRLRLENRDFYICKSLMLRRYLKSDPGLTPDYSDYSLVPASASARLLRRHVSARGDERSFGIGDARPARSGLIPQRWAWAIGLFRRMGQGHRLAFLVSGQGRR